MCNDSADTPHQGLAKPTGSLGALVVSGGKFSIPLLYNELYGIAVWLRDESARWEARGETVAACRCALACILHCFLTLEAYINTYAAWCALRSGSPISLETVDRLIQLPTDAKWLLFPWLFIGRPAFDAGSEPFQSFARLKKLRDNFIVHPKPQVNKEGMAEDRAAEDSWLAAVYGIGTVPTTVGGWPEPRCDAKGAEEACETVRRMWRALEQAQAGCPRSPSVPPLELFDASS